MLSELHARLNQVIALSPVAEHNLPSTEGGVTSGEHGESGSEKIPKEA